MAVTTERVAGDTTIRPFTIEFPEADPEDLRARIAATRFPEREIVEDDAMAGGRADPEAAEPAPPELVGIHITLIWLTNTGVSSGRLSWESKPPFFSVKGVKIPVGVSTFADEIYRVPRSWAERAYPSLVYYNQHDRGGHFAAWEQPQLLSEDVRATFRSLR